MKSKKTFLFLVLIILLGFVLRFYAISTNPPGLYIDEISIGLNAYDILITGKDQYGTPFPLAFQSFGDYKMPVYIYLVSVSMAIFGKTELAVRFPSVFLGTLTILGIFLITRELLKGDKKIKEYGTSLALGSALILAVLPWHIYFSRGGFEVNAALCFFLFGLFSAIRYWKTKAIRNLVTTILLFCLAMYTYHSYRILIPLTIITGLVVFVQNKTMRLRTAFLTLGFFLILSLPLLLFSLTAHGQERLMQTSAFKDAQKIENAPVIVTDSIIFVNNYLSFFSLTYLFQYGDQNNRHQIQNFGLLYLWQLPFIIAGLYFLSKTKNFSLRFMIFLLLLLGPIPPSLAVPSPHTLRFLLGSIPFTILTTLGLYQLLSSKQLPKRFISVITLLLFLTGLMYFVNYYWVHYPKVAELDWGGQCKKVAEAIKTRAPHYDVYVIDKNLPCVPEYFDFYITKIPVIYADVSWRKPEKDENKNYLYIRPYYGNPKPEHLIENITLSNVQHDIFAQVYSL